VHHEKKIAVEDEDDALADAPDPADGPALNRRDRGIDRAEDERAEKVDAVETPSGDVAGQRFEVDNDVRELRQSTDDYRRGERRANCDPWRRPTSSG
jgi:hypothetical protein